MINSYPNSIILENSPCPNGCDIDDEFVLKGHDRLHGISGEFSVVRCRHCNLERTNPRPTSNTIGEYYPMEYAPYHSATLTSQSQSKIKSWFRAFLGLKTRQLPPVSPGLMLEVGCASGTYMEEIKNLGWQVVGIEFSETAASLARAKGFEVQTSSLEDAMPPKEPYDIITAWMVLEHLHEPVKALTRLREWIKPNGYLVALVPDSNSIAKKIFKNFSYDLHLPNHLFHYTPNTLERVLNNSGWKLERVFWQANCNTLLWSAEYWANNMQYLSLSKIIKWTRTSNKASIIRLLLRWLLGVTRQSGRIEIWAKPFTTNFNK